MSRLRPLKSLLIKSNRKITLVEVVKIVMNLVFQVWMALSTQSVPFFFTKNVVKSNILLDNSKMRLLSLFQKCINDRFVILFGEKDAWLFHVVSRLSIFQGLSFYENFL